MASGTVGRKSTSHYSSTSASNLDNNLDALLDDLQTSISGNNATSTPRLSRPQHSSSRIIQTTTSSRQSPLRSTSPYGSISPSQGRTTTVDITTPVQGRATTVDISSPSQGRTTTVEKYVSTSPAGTPSGIPGLEMLDAELQDVQPGQSKTVAYKQVSYHYDKSQEGKNLEPWIKTDQLTKNDASIVDDFCERTFEKSTSSSRNLRDSPDFAKTGKEIIYKADVSTKTIPVPQPVVDTRSTERDFKYIKETSYHTEPSPVSPRKNIKTVRTDETEELTNVEYIPASSPIPPSLAPGPNTKVTTTIKTYTYELPGAPETYVPPPTTTTASISKNLQIDKSSTVTGYAPPPPQEKSITYRVEEQRSGVREYVPAPSPTTSRVHREEKVFLERRDLRQPPPPTVSTSTVSRSERYLTEHRGPTPTPAPPTVTDGTRTTIEQYEEHFTGSRPPSRPTYYPPTETTHHSSSTHMYKYDEQQSLLPRPFPTSERPASPRQQPPKRIEDLMASFSDSEEVVEVMEKRERRTKDSKKEVEFAPHTPPVVKSKNVAGPPIYYPPGSGEFSRKEESMSAMSKASGGWAKERAAWEYGASAKSEEKVKTKKAVVPVCLPLCCALPCVIM